MKKGWHYTIANDTSSLWQKDLWGCSGRNKGNLCHRWKSKLAKRNERQELELVSSLTAGGGSNNPPIRGEAPENLSFLAYFEPFRSHLGDIMTLIVTQKKEIRTHIILIFHRFSPITGRYIDRWIITVTMVSLSVLAYLTDDSIYEWKTYHTKIPLLY